MKKQMEAVKSRIDESLQKRIEGKYAELDNKPCLSWIFYEPERPVIKQQDVAEGNN